MSWKLKSLDQLGYISRGRSRHRPRDAAHLYNGPYPFVQTGDVKHAGLYLTKYSQTYSEEGLAQSRLWEIGTLCITIAANIADTAVLAIDACFPDSVIGFIPEKDKADARFVKYLFDAHLQRRYKKFTQGAAQDNLSQGKLLSLQFPVPDIHEQIEIADKISAYDDLIDNNRRRIQLLEQAARLLYKEWFVHLRFPGHEHATITDGVPERWEKKQVKEILGRVKRPRKIKKSEFLDEGPIPCVDQSRDFIGGYTDDEEAVVDIGQPVIVFGDHTRILKFVDFPFACGADGTQLIVSNEEALSQEFLYFALDSIDLSNYFYARHFKFLKDQHIPRPLNKLLSHFTDNTRPILKQIKLLRNQCHCLSQARDLILPRLMNGEVPV
ncbi:MAG: restriction endonuclease subunit S [Deltaproteobacteria bacterium]|nr:restriction endonuclease subunit S [Deltaproteobacteria bacterium]